MIPGATLCPLLATRVQSYTPRMRSNFGTFRAGASISSLLLALLLATFGAPARGGESWHVTPGAGVLCFTGGQPAHDSVVGTLRAGYDLDAPLSIELGGLAGDLKLRSGSGDNNQETLGGAWADAVFHLARWERLDPFVSAGAGTLWSAARTLPDSRSEATVPRLGAGVLYTLSESWSLRSGITVMSLRATDRHDCFYLFEMGLSYYFGDTTPARPRSE